MQSTVEKWRNLAQVGSITWRDANASWPQPITDDRASIDLPESLGLHVTQGDDEILVYVWVGGWADIDWVDDDERQSLCPEFADVAGACAAVVQNVEDLIGPSSS